MTIEEAIMLTDRMAPGNQFSEEMKIRWLSELDGKIKNEIIDTHEGGQDIPFEGYSEDTPRDKELLANEPYSEMYAPYLLSKIDFYQDEPSKYNNHITMFNTVYSAYADEYNRTVMPIQKSRLKLTGGVFREISVFK